MPSARLSFIPLLTESENERAILKFLDRERPNLEMAESGEVLEFFSFLRRTILAGGIRLYYTHGKESISAYRIDLRKRTYLFKVMSESSPVPYLTGFRQAGRWKEGEELDVSAFEVGCSCAWKTIGPEREARICKHILASMLYLVHEAGRKELPKLRRLLNFVVFSVLYANPSEKLLTSLEKPQREEYKQAWCQVRDSLEDLLAAVGRSARQPNH